MELESRALRGVLPTWEPGFNTFDAYVVAEYLPTLRNSQKVKWFIDHLATHLLRCLPRSSK